MKKMLHTSMIYFALAIAAGVFYREFTKFSGFSGQKALSCVHVHLFVLGMFLFLILALFGAQARGLFQDKGFKRFYALYNVSLPLAACTLLARGIAQVRQIELTKAASATISGVAGIAHILITVSLILLFAALKKNCVAEEAKKA